MSDLELSLGILTGIFGCVIIAGAWGEFCNAVSKWMSGGGK